MQVWYAASYAEFASQKIHDVTEEERKGYTQDLLITLQNINKSQPCCDCLCPVTKLLQQ